MVESKQDGATMIVKVLGWIIWAGLFLSNLVYLLIGFMMSDQEGSELQAPIKMALVIVSVFCFIASIGLAWALPHFLLKKGTLDSSNPLHLLLIFGICIIGWALADSIAVYGLVLFMMSKDLVILVPFVAVTALLFLGTTPRVWSKKKQSDS